MENIEYCKNCKWFSESYQTCHLNPPQMFFNIEKDFSPQWLFPKVKPDNICSHFYFGR